jgi:hypothetical protein
LNFYVSSCTLSQALKRDGYRCILSGKMDSTVWSTLEGKVEAAEMAFLDARDVENAPVANPSDPTLRERAAQRAKEYTKLKKASDRAAAILATNLDPPVATNAAHIFAESTYAILMMQRRCDAKL